MATSLLFPLGIPLAYFEQPGLGSFDNLGFVCHPASCYCFELFEAMQLCFGGVFLEYLVYDFCFLEQGRECSRESAEFFGNCCSANGGSGLSEV